MKKLITLSMMLSAAFIFGQKKEFDQKMMGCFKGSEVGQQVSGMSKYWISCRLENGKSILLFVAVDEDGTVTQTTENGQWWTSQGKYYEWHKESGMTDIYNYQVLPNGDIRFKSVVMMGKKTDTYEFVDYLIPEDDTEQ